MLPCPTCGANIDARNDVLGIAPCAQCGGLFEWPALQLSVPPIAPPKRVRVERRDGKVRTIRWRRNPSAAVIATAMMLAFITGVSYLWTADMSWWPFILPTVGIGAVFWHQVSLAVGINIELGSVISIRAGIGRRRRFDPASIRQPFVRWGNALCATQADGTVVTLARGFARAEEARYVEHELEAALGIEDARAAAPITSADCGRQSGTLRSLRLPALRAPRC
jgi:hypothetical protein